MIAAAAASDSYELTEREKQPQNERYRGRGLSIGASHWAITRSTRGSRRPISLPEDPSPARTIFSSSPPPRPPRCSSSRPALDSLVLAARVAAVAEGAAVHYRLVSFIFGRCSLAPSIPKRRSSPRRSLLLMILVDPQQQLFVYHHITSMSFTDERDRQNITGHAHFSPTAASSLALRPPSLANLDLQPCRLLSSPSSPPTHPCSGAWPSASAR